MSDEHFGFLAYVDADTAANLPELLDESLRRSSFEAAIVASRGHTEFRRQYTHPSGWRLDAGGDSGQGDSRLGWQGRPVWAFTSISYTQVRTLPGEVLLHAIRDACIGSRAIIGRSFDFGGQAMLDLEELSGAVNMLDWIQYFGPDITRRLGADRIAAAGFFSAEALPNGASLALTRSSYLDEWPFSQRRAVVDGLGIVPRHLRFRMAADQWGEMKWC